MTSIKFVKPQNDNKIRNFSLGPEKSLSQQQMSTLNTSTFGGDSENVVHITTPKRKNVHIPLWNLFITSTEPTPHAGEDNSQYKDAHNVADEKSSAPTIPSLEKSNNTQVKSAGAFEDASKMAFFTYDTNENIVHSSKSRSPSRVSEFQRSSSCGVIYGSISSTQQETPTEMLLLASKVSKPSRKCPILNFYANFGQVEVEDKVWDVQDEEVSGLPEVGTPTKLMSPTQPRQSPRDFLGTNNHQPPCNSDAEAALGRAPKGAPKADANEEEEEEGMVEEDAEENKSFFSRHAGTFRRSVSAAALGSFCQPESFFSSINDDKFYELGCSQPAGIDDPIFLTKQYRKARKNAWGKQDRDFDKIEEHHRNNNGGSSDQVASGSKNINTTNKPGSPYSSTLVETFSARYGDAKDHPASERLKRRRFALADPERMIMSQALREKIEKEVEKRKASVTRKVSQFFNVRMGLNREEDLV
ncbi:uncharacterized protein LOC118478763 [Aplysia californica]|uniref:Uncharacterized protein LOC118478763 n=1 Tax=Aplysia californica TaxID=6500 RepID=A0ABM1W2D7_APLCA|nr:uncharacterized protein LOC118478763 [Aplysia californica]